jgi:hypothetical protein
MKRSSFTILLAAIIYSASASPMPIEARSNGDGSGDTGLYVRCERGMKPPAQRITARKEDDGKAKSGEIMMY